MNQQEQLYTACGTGDLEKIKNLVKDGADIHYEKYCYCTPFEKASANGHLEIVKWLYEQGADPTTDNNWPIRWASRNGHLEVVKYLHSIGCDPTTLNNYAIRFASGNSHLEVVKYLVSVGCDPTAQYNQAIVCASDSGHLEVVKFLALIGCDTNKIKDIEMRKTAEDYKKYKPIMDTCIAEIYGNPRLERTKTENEISFKEYLN